MQLPLCLFPVSLSDFYNILHGKSETHLTDQAHKQRPLTINTDFMNCLLSTHSCIASDI